MTDDLQPDEPTDVQSDEPTDVQPDEHGPVDEPAAEATTPRGTAAAQAASRARRIGGRPTPGPRPSEPAPPAAAEPAESAVPASPGQAGSPVAEPAPRRRFGRRGASPDPAEPATPAPADGPAEPAEALPPEPELPGAADRRILFRIAAGVGLLAVALVVANIVLFTQRNTPAQADSERDKILAQAKTRTAQIVSYDYRHLAQDAATAEAGMINPFKSDYAKSIATVVKPQASQVKAVVTFQLENAALISTDSKGDQADVLIFGQQAVSNTSTGNTPRLDVVTLDVTLNKVNGQWLVSNVKRV